MLVTKRGLAQAEHLFSDSAHGMRARSAPLALLGLCAAVCVVVVALLLRDAPSADAQHTVARADVEMIVLPKPVPRATSEPVSQLISQPVRIIDKSARSHDLNALVTDVLISLGHQQSTDDPLRDLLVQTLAERQSDAYIDAALNAAWSRGQISPPSALISATGDVDTALLLNAVLAQSGS